MSFLSKLKTRRRKYGLREYLRREANRQFDRFMFHSDYDDVVSAFRRVGMRSGMTVCVHSSLSRLGYIAGGADTIIDALQDTVGPQGCIMMPTFSMAGTMQSYFSGGQTFDVMQSPSTVGAITETFRRRTGVIRSLHPTNSVAAWGKGADELVRDHDQSATPFGLETPYGRLAEADNAHILMINTHVQSFLHHIQERVGFPNLFLPDSAQADMVDVDGAHRTLVTKVMRPRIPYYVAIDAGSGSRPDWALLHDFALMFPSGRDAELEDSEYRFSGYPQIYERRARFIADGYLLSARLGRGEVGLLNVPGFLQAILPEFERSLSKFARFYDLSYLESIAFPPIM